MALNRVNPAGGEACARSPGSTHFSYKWQPGLRAVNQTSANLVRGSTSGPLSLRAGKEDTTPRTIERVSAVVYENHGEGRKDNAIGIIQIKMRALSRARCWEFRRE